MDRDSSSALESGNDANAIPLPAHSSSWRKRIAELIKSAQVSGNWEVVNEQYTTWIDPSGYHGNSANSKTEFATQGSLDAYERQGETSMKDRRTIVAIGAFLAVGLIGCCVLAASGTLLFSGTGRLFSGSARPDHHGVYLKRGRGLVELQQYRGVPGSRQTSGIPSTSSSRPTLVLWEPTINLNYLELYEPATEWYGDYTTAPSGEMIEVTPRDALGPGRYCFVQGDPLGFPTSLSHWCFEVE